MIIFMKVNFVDNDCNIVNTGKLNMELDLKMLQDAILSQSQHAFVRFYNWSPKCISLGKNQAFEEFYNDLGIDIVRRPTGGRALLHDKELTYCFVSPIKKGQSIIESYMDISDALILGFKRLGIELEYASARSKNLRYCMNISCGADVSYNGKKLIGSAQFRSRGYLLQHGSILYDIDYELVEKIFKQEVSRDSIITLNQIDKNLSQNSIISALKSAFKEKFETT